MKNWMISPDAPSGTPRTDGDVWIRYSVDGNTFNALKNGIMMVATISASQYVDGAWVDKEAKSYHDGEWVDWYNKNARIAELNATQYARYSEGVEGEYVRTKDRGFTRASTLPAIWCWFYNGTYMGHCLIAASTAALERTSATINGGMSSATCVTNAGNTVHVIYMGSAWDNSALGSDTVTIYSDGNAYKLLKSKNNICFNGSTLSPELSAWADELLFGVR